MNLKLYILSLTAWLSFSNVQAQPGTTTEAEVNIQATFIEGNLEKIMGNYDKAVVKYKEVLKKKPNHPAVNYELARVYDVMDEDENALKAIKAAVEQDETNNMWYRMFLGDVYQKMEKNTEAADVFKALVTDYPDEEHHYLKQAFFLVKAKKTAEAIKAYDQMEKRFGISEEFIRRKHTLYLGMGQNKKAAKELQKLIAMDSENTDYLHLLAGFYDQIGEAEQARIVYNDILQLDPQDAKAQLALAGGTNKNDDVTYLNTLKPIFNNEEEDIDLKIKALFPYIAKVSETKEPALSKATIDLADILCQVHPAEAKAFSIHGDLLYHTGQPIDALASYKKTLELDNSVFAVWEQILYIHAETGNTDALIASSNEAIDLFPNQAKTYYFQGIGQMNKANHQEAIAAFQQAALMSRRNPALRFEVLTKMAIEQTTIKKYEAAKKQLDKATEIRADDYRVFDAQGFWHLAQGQTKEASNLMEKALAKGGNDPLILEHYGDLQAALGKAANATKYWKMALDKGGNAEDLKKKMGL